MDINITTLNTLNMNKEHKKPVLWIIRGIPGCGKSTVANLLCERVFEADAFFMSSGTYKFNTAQLGLAHDWCKKMCEATMIEGVDLAVSNTSTTMKEMKPYYDLAEKYGYTVFSIIVENRHDGTDVHNVPKETLMNMRKRFEISL